MYVYDCTSNINEKTTMKKLLGEKGDFLPLYSTLPPYHGL